MNTAPVFDKSFLPPMTSVLNSDHWGTVMNLYEDKKYKESIHGVLEYIQKGLSEKSVDADKNEYVFPHGSIVVSLKIKEDRLFIEAPFLKIPAKYLIPLMRQVAELNFGTLVLAQILLEGNDIYFRYDAPLELCEPYKIYRVIEEICIQADANDDTFIEKFGAQRFSEMQIEHFTSEENDLAWTKFQEYLQNAIDYYDYFQSKRWDAYGWDAFFLAFTRIDFYMRPQGILKSEVEKAVKDLNSSASPNERVNKAHRAAEKLLKMEKEKFIESIYSSKQFVSEKPTLDVAGIHNYLNKYYNTGKNEMNKRDYIGASLTLLTGMYGLLYYYVIPETSYNMIVQGLEKAGGKSWGDAASSLWKTFGEIMHQDQRSANRYGYRDM